MNNNESIIYRKEITKLKPSSYSSLQKYLGIEDLRENINNLNELIDIRELCDKEFSINESVEIIDEEKDGKIIEILKDNKYKIKTNEGEILIKSKECLFPIVLPSLSFSSYK